MKKTKLLAVVLLLALLLAACGPDTPTTPGTVPTTPTTPTDPSNPTDPTVPTTPDIDPPLTVQAIRLTGAKTDFAFGEAFGPEGLEVIATMSDQSEKTLESGEYTVECPEYDPMKPGTYQAVVRLAGTDMAQRYEVTVRPADRLKVLMIGNSYADDAINYAYEIARSAGLRAENIVIADIYIGGCSLDTHWQNAQSGAAVYRFGLEKDGWFDGNSYQNWTIERAIQYTDWDYITLQQNSGNSGKADSYADLQKLMDYVLEVATDTVNNPNANPNVKLVWHQTWAYAGNSANAAFGGYGRDQKRMYSDILSCLQSQVLTKDFAAVIPNGTAIQNARTSFLGDRLTRDEYDHLSYDAGRYIAALGLVGTLTGRDMTAVTWKPADSGFEFAMSEEMLAVCKESWANAMAKPYEVTASAHPGQSIAGLLEGKGTQEEPYLIQSAEDLWALSNFTAGGSFGDGSMYFKLTADIDVSAESWQPICASPATGWVETANSFNANFDGNGKTITFVGNYTGDSWAKGLFSAVGGHVHDLTLKGSITAEKGRVGALAAMAMAGARIENVTAYVDITAGNNQVGGIVGYVAAPDVTFIGCVNYGTVRGRELVGGIVGGSWQNVTYIGCVNHGTVTATSSTVGGIVGEKYAAATLTDCANDGTVTGGGAAATAEVGAPGNYAGWLVGRQY